MKILDFEMARSQREDVEITHSGVRAWAHRPTCPQEQARGDSVGGGSGPVQPGLASCTGSAAGRLPFGEGESAMAVLSRPVDRRPTATPLRTGTLNCRSTLDDLIMGLLAKEPENRPESAGKSWSRRSGPSSASCLRPSARGRAFRGHGAFAGEFRETSPCPDGRGTKSIKIAGEVPRAPT